MEERLQKVIARLYGISRRHAEELIAEGNVLVNGIKACLGTKIDCGRDCDIIGNQKISSNALQRNFKQEVWMLFKPQGVVCTHDNPISNNTLEPYVPAPLRRQKWLFVGRLDKDSEGLLLLTNDGDFANRVAHPSANIEKVYRVHLDQPFNLAHANALKQGRSCQGEWLHFHSIRVVNSRKIDVVLHQGKRREIRRLLLAFGYQVLRLKRWKIGSLILDKRLAPGQSRRLTPQELRLIFER